MGCPLHFHPKPCSNNPDSAQLLLAFSSQSRDLNHRPTILTSMEKSLYNLTSSHSSRFQTDWNIVRWFHVVSTDFTPQTCQLGWPQCLLLVLLFHLLLQLGFLVIPVESPLGSHGFCVTRVRMELTCLAACEFSSWVIFIPDLCVRPPDCSTGGCSNFTGSNLIYYVYHYLGVSPPIRGLFMGLPLK
jgi:hypothetical protein